jgi:hypothetical protein
MGLDPYSSMYQTNPYADAQTNRDVIQKSQVEQQMKHAAYMAQQQERFQPISSGPQVTKPMDLASELQTYENLLGGLMEQIDALESRLSPVLLDYPDYPMGRDKGPSPTGSPVTTRVYCLNSALRDAAERVARITQSVNI